jgi:hypothetical protein
LTAAAYVFFGARRSRKMVFPGISFAERKCPTQRRDDREILRRASQDAAWCYRDQYHARKTEEETYSQKALPALQRVISPAKCNFRLVALSWNLVRKFHAGVAKSADAADLRNWVPARETSGVELLKVGETWNGNPEPSPDLIREGVETRRAAPKPRKGTVKG